MVDPDSHPADEALGSLGGTGERGVDEVSDGLDDSSDFGGDDRSLDLSCCFFSSNTPPGHSAGGSHEVVGNDAFVSGIAAVGQVMGLFSTLFRIGHTKATHVVCAHGHAEEVSGGAGTEFAFGVLALLVKAGGVVVMAVHGVEISVSELLGGATFTRSGRILNSTRPESRGLPKGGPALKAQRLSEGFSS